MSSLEIPSLRKIEPDEGPNQIVRHQNQDSQDGLEDVLTLRLVCCAVLHPLDLQR